MKDIQVCGQPVAVALHGEPTASPLLLIHGAGHDHDVWEPVAPGLVDTPLTARITGSSAASPRATSRWSNSVPSRVRGWRRASACARLRLPPSH